MVRVYPTCSLPGANSGAQTSYLELVAPKAITVLESGLLSEMLSPTQHKTVTAVKFGNRVKWLPRCVKARHCTTVSQEVERALPFLTDEQTEG